MKGRRRQHTGLWAVVTALFSLSAAVAVPVLWRGWYYRLIGPLGLEAYTGWSREIIRGAYDAVMDFLVFGAPFSTGVLGWSESGKAHFADCRVLFRLDFAILAVTAVLVLALFVKALRAPKELGRRRVNPPLRALAVTAALITVFGLWAYLDFEGLFTLFHAVCFPGKTNWVFDWQVDEIILILPEAFWAATAALVAGLTLALEGLLALLLGLIHRAKTPKSVFDELKNK